jgi:Undecaprenyl-phosphate glucose phosphotransferase
MGVDRIGRLHFLDGGHNAAPAHVTTRAAEARPVSTWYFVFAVALVDWWILRGLGEILAPREWPSQLTLLSGADVPADMACAGVLILAATRLYSLEVAARFHNFVRRFGKIWPLAAAGLALLLAVYPGTGSAASEAIDFVRLFVSLAMIIGMLHLGRFWLAALYGQCVDRGWVGTRVLLVGTNDQAQAFIKKAAQDRYGVRVAGVFEDGASGQALGMITGAPLMGTIDDLVYFCETDDVDMVVIATPPEQAPHIKRLIGELSLLPLRVSLLPGAFGLEAPANWCAPADGLPGVQLVTVTGLPIDRFGWSVKEVFDWLAALVLALAFAPVLLMCVVGIKLTSPGPVLFRQTRIGYRNREFEVFKFRSMHLQSCDEGRLTERNDPRVFAFGHFMRKLSLDELPQLLNVLRGEMSLVGPRPHMPEATAAGQLYFDAVDNYVARHRVKPGITGWAQVNGWRGPTETTRQIEQRVLCDLYYIDNWSFLLDLQILAKTALVGFFGRNAF